MTLHTRAASVTMHLLARVVSHERLGWEVTTQQRLASLAVEPETFSRLCFENYERVLL